MPLLQIDRLEIRPVLESFAEKRLAVAVVERLGDALANEAVVDVVVGDEGSGAEKHSANATFASRKDSSE